MKRRTTVRIAAWLGVTLIGLCAPGVLVPSAVTFAQQAGA
jgi:hypothetical protein